MSKQFQKIVILVNSDSIQNNLQNNKINNATNMEKTYKDNKSK